MVEVGDEGMWLLSMIKTRFLFCSHKEGGWEGRGRKKVIASNLVLRACTNEAKVLVTLLPLTYCAVPSGLHFLFTCS